jgi:N-acetylglucosamine kinase-like BadF-type ATPase
LSAQIKVIASDKAVNDQVGWSVSISLDGNTAIVGANGADPGGIVSAGAAYVFVRSGTTWSEQQKLIASDKAENDQVGWPVAISSDGNTAIVGARNADPGGLSNAGAAYVFVRSGTTWSEQQKLIASDNGGNFGSSVAFSSDGNTAIVGAYSHNPGGVAYAGAVYVFVRSGTTWSEQQKLTASDKAANESFGYSVAFSSDGNTAIVGAAYADPGGLSNAGAVYVFVRSGTTWSEQQKLTASDKAANDYFGEAVAISSDGNTAIVGAPGAAPGALSDAGAVYVFQ